jgi:hypothetical protein
LRLCHTASGYRVCTNILKQRARLHDLNTPFSKGLWRYGIPFRWWSIHILPKRATNREKTRRLGKAQHTVHEIKDHLWASHSHGERKGCIGKQKDKGDEKGLYKVKREFHTYETEGEIRDALGRRR